MSTPKLFGMELVYIGEANGALPGECAWCHEAIPALAGRWVAEFGQEFCAADCVRSLDNYDGPSEPDTSYLASDDAHRMEQARRLK